MRVRFWGVRGSIPVPGKSAARYGGNTVCVEVRLADGTLVVLDAGTGLRGLGAALLAEGYRGPIHHLLSHLHWDHILGMPFCPPLLQPGREVIRYPLATREQERARRDRPFFAPPFFPVEEEALFRSHRGAKGSGPWKVGSAQLRRILLNHPDGAQGFRIDDSDGSSLAYLTDNELATAADPEAFLESLAAFARGVDVLIHDSQYLEADMPAKRGWGHSTVGEVLALAQKARPRRVVLFHHDPARTDAALDQVGREANAWLRQHAPGVLGTVAREGLALDLPERPSANRRRKRAPKPPPMRASRRP